MTYNNPKPLTGKALTAFHQPGRRIDVYEGAVRSGKTFTTLLAWAKIVRTAPPGLLAMCGRTERTIITNLLIPMRDLFGKKHVSWSTGSGTAVIFGREVNLYGANDESSITKIQGSEFAAAYVDEAAVLPESFFAMLFTRLSIPGARLLATCNPADPRHWFLTEWLERADLWVTGDGTILTGDQAAIHREGAMGGLHRFTFVIDDNEHLDPEYVQDQKNAHTGVFYKRYILGMWVAADGAIYDPYDEDRHKLPAASLPTMTQTLSTGIDYGTQNATRGELLCVGPSPLDGKPALFVTREWAPNQLRGSRKATGEELAADHATWRKGGPSPRFTYVDPAAAEFKQSLAKHGVPNCLNGSNSVLPGIRTIASLFAADRLFISDECKYLLQELPGYVWDPKAAEKGIDAPIKANDHALDALRYAIYSSRHLWSRVIPVIPAEPDPEEEEKAA